METNSSVTIIGCLPPIMGISAYTKEFVSALSEEMPVSFLGFNRIYPKLFYPGKIYNHSAALLEEHQQLRIRNVLDWYNPFGWVKAALDIKTPVVHAQWWSWPLAPIYWTLLSIARARGKKIIITVHNIAPHERNFLKKSFNRVFASADGYIVHTQKNKQELESVIRRKEIYVVPHGKIKIPLRGVSKMEARRSLGIDADDKILLHFGHIRAYKGLDVALRALAQIKDPRVKLLVAGQCWEKWSKYQEMIEAYQLKDRVFVRLGLIPENEIEFLFTASDLVVLPYKYFSAQSGVGALAVNFDIPMLVSTTGGLADYTLDPACRFDVNDLADFVGKIEKILSEKELYDKLVSDVQQLKEALSWESIVRKTREIYENL